MKKLTILMLTLFLSTALFAEKVKIKGKVSGASASMATQIQIFHQGYVAEATVKDGMYSTEIDIDKDQFVEVYMWHLKFYLYATPGKDINVDFIINTGFDAKMSGIDKNDYANLFMLDIQKLAYESELSGIISTDFAKAPNAAKKFSEGINKLFEKYATKTKKKYPNLKDNLDKMSHYLYTYANADKLNPQEIEKELNNFKNSGYSIHAITVPYFKECFKDLLSIKTADKLKLYGLDYDLQKDEAIVNAVYAEQLVYYSPSQPFTNFLFFDIVGTELMLNKAKNKTYLDYIFANVDSKSYDQYEKQYQDELKKLEEIANKGVEKAFDFKFLDKDGKEYRLDDFKGKLIYIDCWASWCAPCRGQIPALIEIEKKYEGKDIVFLSVSVDNSKAAWLKAVEEENLHGYVLHAPGAFKNDFAKHYGINSIPRFLLFDANGNVVNDNMPRPAEAEDTRNIIDVRLYDSEVQSIINKHLEKLNISELKGKMFKAKQSYSMMGLKFKSEVYSTLNNEYKSIITPENPEILKMLLGPKGAKPSTTITKNGYTYTNGEKQVDHSLPVLFGYELAYLVQKGVKFTMNKKSFDDEVNAYVLDCELANSHISFYISKDNFLLSKKVQTTIQSRRDRGGKYAVESTYDHYGEKNGRIYLKKYSMMGMMQYYVEEFDIVDYDPEVFKVQ